MIIVRTLAVLYRYMVVVLSTPIVVKRYKYRDDALYCPVYIIIAILYLLVVVVCRSNNYQSEFDCSTISTHSLYIGTPN